MSVYYSYANYSKHERFGVDAVGGSGKLGAFGYTLASRAFHLMLVGPPRSAGSPPRGSRLGRWAGDSIAIVSESNVSDWEQFETQFTDIEADAILTIFHADGFEQIGQAAQGDVGLFMELCHLAVTRQAIELDSPIKAAFGVRYLHRYKELCNEYPWFRGKDLIDPS